MGQFTQSNDQVKGYWGDGESVALPTDFTAEADLSYLDSVEFSSTADKFRAATGADASRYIGIVADSSGIKSGKRGSIVRGVVVLKTLSGSVTQGDAVRATNGTTVAKQTLLSGVYSLAKNTFGQALESGTTGATIRVLVEPELFQ